MRNYFLFALWVVTISSACAQERLQMYITANANYYLPRNSAKQSYPILAYDDDADPKMLVGGFGVGFMISKNVNNDFLWRAQLNMSRRAYWNEPMSFTDGNNVPLGNVVCKGVDFVALLAGTVHYRISENFSAGTGLGFDRLLYSKLRLPAQFHDATVANGYYRVIVPLIPVELSISFNKVLVNLRYQHALMNRLKSPISDYKDDSYSALFIEVGYRIY